MHATEPFVDGPRAGLGRSAALGLRRSTQENARSDQGQGAQGSQALQSPTQGWAASGRNVHEEHGCGGSHVNHIQHDGDSASRGFIGGIADETRRHLQGGHAAVLPVFSQQGFQLRIANQHTLTGVHNHRSIGG